MTFDAKKVKNELVNWIRKTFEENGKNCNAVIGISGGKDSTVVAALCVEALGKDRVFGVLMPNGVQKDIEDSYAVVKHLGIKSAEINIGGAYQAIIKEIESKIEVKEQSIINLPPRLRMSTLYAVSQSLNGRVINTSNRSEAWVGYSTRYGDSVGDFAPLLNLTVSQVRAIGRELDLPVHLVDKIPSDGLSGKSDEDKLGFTYDVLDEYLLTGVCRDEKSKELIDRKHAQNTFKQKAMPSFKYEE